MTEVKGVYEELELKFPNTLSLGATKDDFPTVWVNYADFKAVLSYLKDLCPKPYKMLFDLTAVDERLRSHKDSLARDFTLTYLLLSFDRNEFIRLNVPLKGEYPSIPSITDLWSNANWYEREVWDLFGIRFEGHPNLRRILLPPWWTGHPLRKEYPARATEMPPFTLPEDKAAALDESLRFKPEEWGMSKSRDGSQFLFLNLGPQHPGTHGPFRIVLELDGEEIVDCVPDIGYHHRAAEKMSERQTWHTYIPYLDRVDYLAGAMNAFPYLLAVEKLAGIDIPDRAKFIRIMIAELFRISNHLVFYGTFAQDTGAMSPVFFMFTDREKLFQIIEAICGGRMHTNWFRIGGVAQDLPKGWKKLCLDFVDYMPKRLDQYETLVMQSGIFQARTKGVGSYTTQEAIEWGVTGPGLRATGLAWDFRKQMPYSGYDALEFDIPVGVHGDSYDRCRVHIEEMRQSLRIIKQCAKNMPEGNYKADNPLTTPPQKKRTLHDIETLIQHFLNVSWGPVIPRGECFAVSESVKGATGYYVTSDEDIMSYRTRIRTPSFAHLQMLPLMSKGLAIADLIAILGSIDFVLADVDR